MKKISKILLILFLLSLVSCSTTQNITKIRPFKPIDASIKRNYFFNYKKSIQQSLAIIKKEPQNPEASFILGEYFMLKGDLEKSQKMFQTAMQFGNSDIALASLYRINDIYSNTKSIKQMVEQSPQCKDVLCQTVINKQRKSWAIALGNFKKAEQISNKLNAFKNFTLLKSSQNNSFANIDTTTQEEKTFLKSFKQFKNNYLNEKNAKKIKISYLESSLGLYNFFNEISNSILFAHTQITLKKEKTISFVLFSNTPSKIYIDNKMVLKSIINTDGNPATFKKATIKMAKGTHQILIKFTTYQNSSPYFMLFKNTAFTKNQKTAKENLPFDKYISILKEATIKKDVNRFKWTNFYSSIVSSVSPSFLFELAKSFLKEKEENKYIMIMQKILNLYPGFLQIRTDLAEYFIDNDKLKKADNLLKNAKNKKLLIFKLAKADYYYSKIWYKKEFETVKQIYKQFKDYPISTIYLSNVYEHLGNTQKNIETKEKILKQMPYFETIINSLIKLYSDTEQLEKVEKLLKKIMFTDKYYVSWKEHLATVLFAQFKFEEAFLQAKEALKINPKNESLLELAGDIASMQGKDATSLKYYKMALNQNPVSEKIINKIEMFDNTNKDDDFFKQYITTDEKVFEVVLNTKTTKEKGGYIQLFDEGAKKIFESGASISEYRQTIKLLNISGIQKFTKMYIGGMELLRARIIKPTGKITKTFTRDSHYIYFSNLEANDTIDVVTKNSTKPHSWLKGDDFVWNFAMFGAKNRFSRVTFSFPKKMKITFYSNINITPEIKTLKQRKIYTFKTQNLFFPEKETLMPVSRDIIPFLQYSTKRTWQDFTSWQTFFIKEQIREASAVKNKTEELLQQETNKDLIIKILRDFVARKIHYLFNDRGIYKVKPALTSKTLSEKSGDCKDKSLLLVQMLRFAGIKAYYSLVKRQVFGKFIKKLPYMQFDHAIVFIPKQKGINKEFFVDATASYSDYKSLPNDLDNSTALVIFDDTNTYKFKTVKSQIQDSMTITQKSKGIYEMTVSGNLATVFRYTYIKYSDKFKFIINYLSRLNNYSDEIEILNFTQNIYAEPLKFTFKTENFFPLLIKSIFFKVLREDKERHYPLFLKNSIKTITVNLLKNEKLTITPTTLNNKYLFYEIKEKENNIEIKFKIKQKTIPASEFNKFKQKLKEIMDKEAKTGRL